MSNGDATVEAFEARTDSGEIVFLDAEATWTSEGEIDELFLTELLEDGERPFAGSLGYSEERRLRMALCAAYDAETRRLRDAA